MRNRTLTAASNTFVVRDPDAFRAALAPFEIAVVTVEGPQPGRVHLAFTGPWPCDHYDPARGQRVPLDLPALISSHLTAGQVVVLKEAGSHTSRYLTGVALAFNAEGATVSVDLDEIYDHARQLGRHVATDI